MKPLRVVHVGCGKISNAWFKAVKQRSDIEVAGLVDINQAAALRYLKQCRGEFIANPKV